MGAAYVAVTFAALEGADLVLPRLGLPDRVLTLLVILAVLGFPVVLVASWLVDLTPEGLKWTATDDEASEPTSRRPLRIAGLALATAAFGAAAWWWIPRAPAFRPVDLDPDAIAILPFEVRGGEEIAYLREGMLDLLGTKLDGVGGLRVVDPHTVLASLRDEPEGARSVEEIRDVAARLGAGRAVQGSILWIGDSLQVRASAYDVADRTSIDASVDGPPDALFGLVDRLVTELVAQGLVVGEPRLAGLEALTTDSNEALRLYLDGVRNHRAGRGRPETLDLLERAVALDTTFALAAFWAGEMATWFELPEAVRYFELAARHQARLPPRDRMRVAAALAAGKGRYADAIPLYRALVERYPEDVAGWFRYAEELAHSGHFAGQRLADARPAYERAFELDPALAPLYFHLAHIGGLQGDSAALRRWAAGLDSLDVDPLWPAVLRMNEALVMGDSALLARSYARYRAEESVIPASTLASSLGVLVSGPFEYSPGLARATLTALASEALTDTARAVATRELARLDVGVGRFEQASETLLAAAPAFGRVLPQDLAWIALHPDQTEAAPVLGARRLLVRTTPANGTGEAAARDYLLARLALRVGDANEYRSRRSALAGFATASPEIARFAGDLGHELAAIAAGLEGDPRGGLDSLLAASYWRQKQGWLGLPPGTFFDGRLPDRFPMFLRAELLRQAGEDAEAARWFEVAADGPWHRAPALLALAAIRQRAGAEGEAAALQRRAAALHEAGPGPQR